MTPKKPYIPQWTSLISPDFRKIPRETGATALTLGPKCGPPTLVHFRRKVTPNHHALAETFVLMDNYYCSGILSADGHQWTDEAYVTDYIEKFFGDFTHSYPYDGGGALAYASSGFIWDNVLKHRLTFRDYGEFVDAVIEPKNSTFTDMYQDFKSGTHKIKITAKSNLPQLEPYLCPTYVGFPNTVPDVYCANEFIKELKEFEKNNNFPNFIIMLLPNDHTSGTRPGTPTPQVGSIKSCTHQTGRRCPILGKKIFRTEP